MKINKQKLRLAMATACMNPYDLCKAVNIQYQTYRRILAGNNCKPATVGKIAKALNVPVDQIGDMDEEHSDDSYENSLSEYSLDELLDEIKRRCRK